MDWVRDNIRNLEKYKENKSPYRIKLDANESKDLFSKYLGDIDFQLLKNINRYPDSNAEVLRDKISDYIGVDKDNIIAGNGSSEMIELVMKTFIDSGDRILSFVPTFGMYNIFSEIYNAEFIGVKSEGDFSLNMDKLIEKAELIKPKIILICNPNNPTGYLITKNEIKRLLKDTDSLVVVDEAYIEFTEGSMVDEVESYKNLIVLRTFSKAIALAGIRLGYIVSNKELVGWINKIKSPYNLNALTQTFGIMAIKKLDIILEYIKKVKIERENLYSKLKELGIKVYPSNANFILFYSDIDDLSGRFQDEGILIRKLSADLEGYYRITVGEKDENEEFIKLLKEMI